MPEQLHLSLKLRSDAKFNNYFTSEHNRHTVDYISQLAAGAASESRVFLAGSTGAGKSHLLQAAAYEVHQKGGTAFYLPFSEASRSWSPAVLEDLNEVNFLALDDVDAIIGDRSWEEALFYLLHRLLIKNTNQVLISAQKWPQRLACLMPELGSRLAMCLVLDLFPLEDADLAQAFESQCHVRGMKTGANVGRYLVRCYQKNVKHLFESLDEWDRRCLEAHRVLSIPFVKECWARQTMVPPQAVHD